MQQRRSILMLGVDNLAAMRDFYVDEFGWTPVTENKDIVFFKLNGVLLSFFEKEALTQDARVDPPPSAQSRSRSRTTWRPKRR